MSMDFWNLPRFGRPGQRYADADGCEWQWMPDGGWKIVPAEQVAVETATAADAAPVNEA